MEVRDDLGVAAHDPMNLPEIVKRLKTDAVDAVVLFACMQFPSRPAVPMAEAITGKPVLTAAIVTIWQMLKALDLETWVPGDGTLWSGVY